MSEAQRPPKFNFIDEGTTDPKIDAEFAEFSRNVNWNNPHKSSRSKVYGFDDKWGTPEGNSLREKYNRGEISYSEMRIQEEQQQLAKASSTSNMEPFRYPMPSNEIVNSRPLSRREKKKLAVQEMTARWGSKTESLNKINEDWGNLAADPLNALDHSTLLDVSNPKTAAFIDASSAANDYESIMKNRTRTPENVAEFERLVRVADRTWRDAQRYSSQVGTSWMSDPEKKVAGKARNLLQLALDERAPMAERVSAAVNAQEQLKKLLSIAMPEKAQEKITEISAKQLSWSGA